MFAHLLPAICASVFGAVGCQHNQPTGMRPGRSQADVGQPRDTALAPIADTYLRQGSPNQNQGAELILRLQSSGKNRALLRWDQQGLAEAVAGGAVLSARLELTIADLGDNWSTAGRTIELHRMTQAWTELGATWSCAVDSVPGNSKPECVGATAWDMDDSAAYPWIATPTATAVLKNGQTGVVSFDVTADVQAWLASQPNDGWLLKKTVEGDPGMVDFGSRESGTPPRLVLSVQLADTTVPPIPSVVTYPQDSTLVVGNPADSVILYYRTIAAVSFQDTVSNATIRTFLQRHQVRIVGGLPYSRAYVVQFADPGPDWSRFESIILSMNAEPFVDYAVWITERDARPVIHSRFPSDGAGMTRDDWFSSAPGGATWPWRAIRAPLSWGCETGTYGTKPTVGILDWQFGADQPDLPASNTVRHYTTQAGGPLPASEQDSLVRHGTAVAGLVGAVGDNGTGVAGMVWGGTLHLFSLNRYDALQPKSNVVALVEDVLPAAEAGHVRLISSSIGLGSARGDTLLPKQLRKALRHFLEADGGAVWVQSTGNESQRLTYEQLLAAEGQSTTAGLLIALAELKNEGLDDRILFVAGTQPGNELWAQSNLITRMVDIAGPAKGVPILSPNGAVSLDSGTSLAAPLVAGVAAQLWVMDPDLTPEQVKAYIVQGAEHKRLSPTTGDSVSVKPISGTTETIYQLDAYGALTLLSAERPGTPACGFPVSISVDGRSVVLERPAAAAEPLIVASDTEYIVSISVAQGGRLISAFVESYPYGRSVVVDQHGAIKATVPDLERVFLERDTVDGTPSNGGLGLQPTYTLRRGSGGAPIVIQPVSRLPSPPECVGGRVAFSPSGAQLIFALETWESGVLCWEGMTYSEQYWVIPTDGAQPARLVWTSPTGNGWTTPPGDAFWANDLRWSHDGRRMIGVSAGVMAAPITWRITALTEDGTPSDLTVPPGWEQSDYTFSADDSAVVSVEYDAATSMCTEYHRNPATWTAWWHRPPGDCGSVPIRVFPNVRSSQAALALGSPRGASPFKWTAARQAFGRDSTRTPAPFLSRRRVQVN